MTQQQAPQDSDDAGRPVVERSTAAPGDLPRDAAAEALLESVCATYREQEPFSADERERLRRMIGVLRSAAQEMHAYPLTNADEPDPLFVAYRGG